ncbi:hypothetical protein R3W88_016950 [Solanum pinnatisectum]|uniref:Uncharacterized protein n=1 Tax=Solanum pinnatisectum TaxID=50273 RepID=A0AAV9KYT0_9SOLN|nr:hypothetical protein R3W88_016950 [Solanum pinnatisectum]
MFDIQILISLSTLIIKENNVEVVKDVYPFFRVYKDVRVERFYGTYYLPPSQTANDVSSKDIIISSDVSARLYLPKNTYYSQPKAPRISLLPWWRTSYRIPLYQLDSSLRKSLSFTIKRHYHIRQLYVSPRE